MQAKTFSVLLLLFLCGCSIFRPVTIRDVVLLPEDRIYTVPAGQKIAVNLDKKPLEMVFPEDMKLVHSSVLIRQEEKLNDEALKRAKADRNTAKTKGIFGSVLAIISGIFAYLLKRKKK